ncbi:hypothetical protein E4U54_006070 [Claviceps lovelessii]|nr:hypothetical protein E4U54_006070 [Claviceps lovelessii]
MVPPPKELEAALIDGTYHIFTTEPDATTVNKVRKHVEEEQGLEEGFFTSHEWKQKSKAIIKEHVDKLLDGWEPEPKRKQDTNPENGTKRHASEDESSPPKRRKQGTKKGKGGAKPRGRPDSTSKTKTTKARSSKTASRRKTTDAQSSAEESDRESGPTMKASSPEDSGDNASSSIKVDDTSKQAAAEESEEYSDVIDEGPKPKRKKKDAKHQSSKTSKPAAAAATTKKSTTTSTDSSSQEAEIKKLQSQLVKCGIRKLWHNELKQYKDDSRAKIRHLKKMLADIGMDGRFSEAKARAIKEAREILADVDAAQEMNALWGMGGGRRASRGKQHKSAERDDSDDGGPQAGAVKNGGIGDDNEKGDGDSDADDDDDDDDDQATSFAARRRRAQADLAFLGDESESD